MLKDGNPRLTWTSTDTALPSTPTNVADDTVASTGTSHPRASWKGPGRRPPSVPGESYWRPATVKAVLHERPGSNR
jgi:hypothetical protein